MVSLLNIIAQHILWQFFHVRDHKKSSIEITSQNSTLSLPGRAERKSGTSSGFTSLPLLSRWSGVEERNIFWLYLFASPFPVERSGRAEHLLALPLCLMASPFPIERSGGAEHLLALPLYLFASPFPIERSGRAEDLLALPFYLSLPGRAERKSGTSSGFTSLPLPSR